MKTLTLALVCMLFLTSCDRNTVPKSPVFDDYKTNPTVEKADESLGKVVKELPKKTTIVRTEALNTKNNANSIESKITDENRSIIKKDIDSIRSSSDTIVKTTVEIEELHKELIASQGHLQNAKIQIDKMEKVFETTIEAKNESDKMLADALEREKNAIRKLIHWTIGLCMLGFAISAGLIYFGSTYWGFGSLAVCAATLVIAITIDQFYAYIPWVGLGMVAIAVGVILYKMFKKEKAVEEIIETTEVAKQALQPAARRKLFGYGADKGTIFNIQSKSTENIVNEKRAKMKKMWDHTILNNGSEDMDEYESNIIRA